MIGQAASAFGEWCVNRAIGSSTNIFYPYGFVPGVGELVHKAGNKANAPKVRDFGASIKRTRNDFFVMTVLILLTSLGALFAYREPNNMPETYTWIAFALLSTSGAFLSASRMKHIFKEAHQDVFETVKKYFKP